LKALEDASTPTETGPSRTAFLRALALPDVTYLNPVIEPVPEVLLHFIADVYADVDIDVQVETANG
tara:strand:- start:345 stop:542 length:198 start_codon:yes stop_codon:yes gene_type:complete